MPSFIDRSRDRKGLRAPLTRFAVRDVAEGSAHTLVLSGELDMVASPDLQAAISVLCREGASRLVLDLSELTFMDLMGLRTVTFAKELCEWHRCDLRLVPGPDSVQRVFALTGLLDAMPFEADPLGAAGAVTNAPGARRGGAR
ncbi:MAG TPA: STAS domain-containing protein [Solirubrobacteraceae bacterium]|nr:STAS domain-containing protein [Solirubrobacteraceae bacterium]